MEVKDGIDILLKEYDTLRAEVLQRLSARNQLITVVVAIAAFIGNQNAHGVCRIAGYSFAAALVLGAIWTWFLFDIDRCAIQLSAIESRVNRLATDESGLDELLTWETKRLSHAGDLENRMIRHLVRRYTSGGSPDS